MGIGSPLRFGNRTQHLLKRAGVSLQAHLYFCSPRSPPFAQCCGR